MSQVVEHLEALPESLPVIALFVNEELSGDKESDVVCFWQEQGASDELLQRITWREKSYAFLRGWTDQGVPEDDIVRVMRHLRALGLGDSRDLFARQLETLSPAGAALDSPLFLDHDVEDVARHPGIWHTCGGGRDECLAEMHLVLQAHGVPYQQLDRLTY